MAMRDKNDIRLLRFAELAQRLEQTLPGEKFGEPDVRTAVTLLANQAWRARSCLATWCCCSPSC